MTTNCPTCATLLNFSHEDSGNFYTCPTCQNVHEYPRTLLAKVSPAPSAPAPDLVLCRDCKQPISERAVSCPHCGRFRLTLNAALQVLLVFIGAAFVLCVFVAILLASLYRLRS